MIIIVSVMLNGTTWSCTYPNNLLHPAIISFRTLPETSDVASVFLIIVHTTMVQGENADVFILLERQESIEPPFGQSRVANGDEEFACSAPDRGSTLVRGPIQQD